MCIWKSTLELIHRAVHDYVFKGKKAKPWKTEPQKVGMGGKEKSKAEMVFWHWINEGYGFHPETQSKTTFKH